MSQTIPQQTPSEASPEITPQQQLQSLLTTAGVAPLSQSGWIKITGSDRVRWLNGMVTNSVQELAAGEGSYNLILNAQGRIQGDGYIFAEPDHLLLQTGLRHVPGLMTLLDRFIIMDDVELSDVSPGLHGLLLAGPQASEVLRSLDLAAPQTSTQTGKETLIRLAWRSDSASKEVIVIRAYSPLVPRFEIWSDEAASREIAAAVAARGITQCTPSAIDPLRILEGTPLFGVDIRDRDLPQETGATRALHSAKGCYLGQEIVERIRSRGNVHRTFQGFQLHGGTPAAGLALSADGKPAGELTSVATIPSRSGPALVIGLGYIRREALALAKPIQYEGGHAEPIPLPVDQTKIL